MRAQSLTPLMVQALPVVESPLPASTYYRSRLFVSGFSNNPLLAAASPLFSLLDRLSISNVLPPVTQLRDNLAHELKAFDSRLQDIDTNAETIRMARFMLCATIDESVGKNYLRTHNDAINFQAFSKTADPEKTPQALFFDVLDIIKGQAYFYLDLLEFAYFCLISGIEGPYHNKPDGRQQLDEQLDAIYHCILKNRTQRPQHDSAPPVAEAAPKSMLRNKKNLWWAALFLGVAILALGQHYLLDRKVQTLRIHAPSGQEASLR